MLRFLILFFPALFFSQSIRVVYKVTQYPNKDEKTYSEVEYMYLDIDNKTSYYYSPKYFNLKESNSTESEKKELLKSLKSAYIIKKDNSNNKLFNYIKLDDFYAYEDKEVLNWKLLNDKKQILNKICSSAELSNYRGRSYIAHYTNEIIIQDGPYKFCNLPGLILKVQSKDGDWIFEAVEIKKLTENLKDDIPYLSKNIKIYSRENYLKILKDISLDPSKNARIDDQMNKISYNTYINGNLVSREEKYKLFNEMIWNFMKTHNNPIEKDDIWIR